jgi:hypothetical protein
VLPGTCTHPAEYNDHLFQFQAVWCRRRKSSFLTTIQTQAEAAKTDPRLIGILLAGMRSYLDCKPFSNHKFTTLPKRCYVNLIPSQEAIGWGQLVCGWLSTVWADLQQDYMIHAQNLWTLRNKERHGKEQTQK